MADIKYARLSTKDIEDEILRVRLSDLKMEKELCFALTEKAKLENDDYALAFSYTFLGDYYLAVRENDSCIVYLNRSRVLSESRNFDDLLIRTYKFIGMFYSAIYDEQTALEYYLKSLRIAEDHHDIDAISAVYNNIADCFEMKKNYREAFYYYKMSFEVIQEHQCNDTSYSKAIALTNLCNISFHNHDAENLYYYLSLFKKFPKNSLSDNKKFLLLFCECLYDVLRNNEQLFLANADQLFELQTQLEDQLLAYDIFQNVCSIFLDLKKETYAKHCLNWLVEINQNEDVRSRKEIQKLCIRYCQIFDMKEMLARAYEDFYKIIMAIEDIDLDTHSAGLNAKIELYHAKEEQSGLKKEMEQLEALMNIDDLTNTLNRRCFNQELQDSKLLTTSSLAIAMLDIDYFKEYNDLYGHQMGDTALIEVGMSLNAISSSNIQTFRYGGDEFSIIFKNCSEQKVADTLSDLKQDILNKKIEHLGNANDKNLSICYGYAYSEEDTKDPEALLQKADQKLYDAKKSRSRKSA